MAQTPDDDTWLQQIRCPQYFDFEAALTVPCPNGGDTNPPLRDAVYESDDETRTFFRALETDASLHHTPHPQENSPPRAELRNLRPIYRHRPTTTFEEYLQIFRDSSNPNPSRDSRSPVSQSNSARRTPSPRQKGSLTPRQSPRGKPLRTPSKATRTSNPELKTPTLDSVPTPKCLKRNPATKSRLPFHTSAEATRKSAPNEPVAPRRRRPPERVTPPSNPVASKTTSGGFGRAKSRKAIARSENADTRQEPTSRFGQRPVPSDNVSPKGSSENVPSQEKQCTSAREKETDLLDVVDPDILRMMEEHNRRLQRKKAQTEGKEGREVANAGTDNTAKNRSRERNVRPRDVGITLRNTRKEVSEPEEVLQWDQHVGIRDKSGQHQVSSSKGSDASDPKNARNVDQDHVPRLGARANQQTRQPQPSRQTEFCLQQSQNLVATTIHDDSKGEETSLDELLKSENERVLEERKRRLPERRRALQVDKNVALKTFEGQRAGRDRQRTIAKVEFTSSFATGSSQAGTSSVLETIEGADSGSRDREKENRGRDRPLGTISRKRGLKGFRERSMKGLPRSVSSGLSAVPSNSQKPRNAASTRRRQPYTDKIKAAERQKRLEKKLEEDLQLLLSQHNSRVQGNRRTYAADER